MSYTVTSLVWNKKSFDVDNHRCFYLIMVVYLRKLKILLHSEKPFFKTIPILNYYNYCKYFFVDIVHLTVIQIRLEIEICFLLTLKIYKHGSKQRQVTYFFLLLGERMLLTYHFLYMVRF